MLRSPLTYKGATDGMTMMKCPVCGEALVRGEKEYRCGKNHSFDLAAQGYVNLLISSKKHTAVPGDSKEMVAARERFLHSGAYGFLQREVSALCCRLMKDKERPVVVDAGCGEGYYTCDIEKSIKELHPQGEVFGFDISKFALRSAGKKARGVTWAVASIFDMPLETASADLAVNIFAPLAGEEFARVIRPGGYLVTVTPGAEHLFEMKEILYPHPYRNDVQTIPVKGFVQTERLTIEEMIQLEGREQIADLFQMTPYFWRTPKEGRERLETLDRLTTKGAFLLTVYQREGSGKAGAEPLFKRCLSL